jgi:hypothetical protein
MRGLDGQFLSGLLGGLFIRLIVVGTVLLSMAALWQGAILLGLGLALALAYFLHLYWQSVQVQERP